MSLSRYDDVDHLLLDLDTERKYKDTIEMENIDLEKMNVELEGYLRHLDEVALNGSAEDNEWKMRYEIQKCLDNHLCDHRAWLEAELAEMEWKYHTGNFPEAMNCNVDLLTELELIRLVKHMDRVKADYYNSVRETEYKTEKEMKDFHLLDEKRRTYKTDLKHASQNMERIKMDEILDRQAACTPPLFSPSYVRWLDSQSLDEVSHGLKSSKSSKHRSKSLSKEGRRSSSKSPSRSKSRNQKSASQKKDESDPAGTEVEAASDLGEKNGAAAAATDESKEGGGEEGSQ